MTSTVIALVGDLVASRHIQDRIAFDDALVGVMRERSRANPAILSPYTLIGDEVQAVYADAGGIFHDAVAIMAAIHPQRMRFAFGVGTLVKPINPEHAIGMDGPAFHRARDGVEALKRDGGLLTVRGEPILSPEMTRLALHLISHNMAKWNRTRFQTLAMLFDETPVKRIAESLGLTEQAIYKTINAGALETILGLFREVSRTINRSL